MKGGTMTRLASMIGFIGGMFGRPITRHYDDPVLHSMPHTKRIRSRSSYRHRRNDTRPMMRRGNLGPPPCQPGTITYHDKLVRHFGRRQANRYGKLIRAGELDALPTAEDFAANPPWRFYNG